MRSSTSLGYQNNRMLRCVSKTRVKWTISLNSSSRVLLTTLNSIPSPYIYPRSVQLALRPSLLAMAKRKSSTIATEHPSEDSPLLDGHAPPAKRRASGRRSTRPKTISPSTNPHENANVLDAPGPLRASPDAEEEDERMDLGAAGMDVAKQVKVEKEDEPSLVNGHDSDSSLSEILDMESPVKPGKQAKAIQGKTSADPKSTGNANPTSSKSESTKAKKESPRELQFLDPEADDLDEADEEEIQAALSRPPQINSDYLPLPWKGRIGYVGLLFLNLRYFAHLCRPAYVHISASLTLQSSLPEPAVSPPFSRIAIH